MELAVDEKMEPFFVIANLAKNVILGQPFLSKSFALVNKTGDPHECSRATFITL